MGVKQRVELIFGSLGRFWGVNAPKTFGPIILGLQKGLVLAGRIDRLINGLIGRLIVGILG
jgi:hypothetical protein